MTNVKIIVYLPPNHSLKPFFIMSLKLKHTENDSWWVIVLKVIVYAIGLILAGMGTAQAANMVGIF